MPSTPAKETPQGSQPDPKRIDAMPTKTLFIDMLTRDIPLIPAILDLVDNCVDGARNLRGNDSFEGLWVRLEISKEQLRIIDNCGGIDVETARSYAFRFGRDEKAPSIRHSIGRFGVGMKRALFKLGEEFEIKSTALNGHFRMQVDVPTWALSPNWEFKFNKIQENLSNFPPEKRGTEIVVRSLRTDVAAEFSLANFETELSKAIKSRMQEALSRGLSITLNQIPIGIKTLELLSSLQLAPVYKKITYRNPPEKPVVVKLYCGLGASEGRDARAQAGWHVFCNGRLVLEADKTAVTGWGEQRETKIPGFHGQYNYFRGFVYFDSDDAGRLPWNTTKTGLDQDSPIYRLALLQMRDLMRPVIDFLNKLKDEKQETAETGEAGPLQNLVAAAVTKDLTKVKTRSLFELPKIAAKVVPRGPRLQPIQYKVPYDKVQIAKKTLGVTSFKKVGEETFNYYFEAECDTE